jgi:CubicO group peptidase (beta-lactamase class C family)
LFLCVALGLVPAAADELPRVAPEAAGLKAEGLRRLDALLTDAVERKQIAGAVALLARRGKVGYLRAVGMQDVEAGKPMTPDTLFRIASMTKPITSVAALMLVDDGKLRLNDPLSKYVPAFRAPRVLVPGEKDAAGGPKTVPAEREITIHHLLTHTSGITYGFFGKPVLSELYRKAGVSDGLTQTEGTLEEGVNRLAALPLLNQPGAAWEYGLSTDVLGRVIEVASGKSLDAFFRERIFTPLEMRDTVFFLPPEKKPRLAALYEPGPDKAIRRTGEEPVTIGPLVYSASYPYRGPRTYFSDGAGLTSTASDYARFLQMLLDGGTGNGVRLLKPETVQLMLRNQIGDLPMGLGIQGQRFGYGFGIASAAGKDRDAPSVGSFSWGGFFHTMFWADPQKQLLGVLLVQLYPSGNLTLQGDFRKRTYQALAD